MYIGLPKDFVGLHEIIPTDWFVPSTMGLIETGNVIIGYSATLYTTNKCIAIGCTATTSMQQPQFNNIT